MNLARLLERSASAHGERPALAFGRNIQATYRAFYQSAGRLALGLRERQSVRPGERVALFCPNHRSYLVAMYATWIAGAVAVPINSKLHPREAKFILDDSGAIACWTDADCDSALIGAGVRCPLLDVDAVDRYSGSAMLPLEPRNADDLAWLFYTSGTTGRPKGVMLSHANLLHATLAFLADVQPVAPGDAILHAAPQSHGSGLYNFAYVANGGINVVPESRGFDGPEVLALASHFPGSSLFAAPTMVRRLVDAAKADPASTNAVGTVIYGGGPMYVADLQDAIAVMGQRFAQIYGQGEAPMTITVLPKHVIADTTNPRYLERLASVGYPHVGIDVSIRDSDGASLRIGDVGEVCARGPVVMQGYWNNPEASRSSLRDGWLYTGDVGALDADGFLTLKDRSKDVIISGGANIYPREVEEVLLLHPRVREVGVIGMPDQEWGESVVAFVVADAVTPVELDALCLDRIARFKRPRQYRFVLELPKNNYGKVLKTELRKLL